MRYNHLKLSISNTVKITSLEHCEYSDLLKNKMAEYQENIVLYLTEYQNGIRGFRSMGTELSKDKFTNDDFLNTNVNNELKHFTFFRTSENKRAFYHLLVNRILPASLKSKIILIVFNKGSIGKFLFDSTQIQVYDIKENLEELLTFFKIEKELEIDIIEIIEFKGYKFQESDTVNKKKYFKIYSY